MPNLCGIPDFEHTISSVEACYVILYHCVILIFVIVLLNKMWVVTRSMSMPSRSDVEPKCWQNLPSHADAIVKSDLGLQLPSAMQAPTQTISLVQHAGPEGPVGGRLPGFRHSKCSNLSWRGFSLLPRRRQGRSFCKRNLQRHTSSNL